MCATIAIFKELGSYKMVLATQELKKIAKDNITCLNDANIRGASIDLSLDEMVKVRIGNQKINLFDIKETDDSFFEKIYKKESLAKEYELKPQTYLYGQTCEEVSIPKDKCGLILPRSTFVRVGLILPMSLYANPGYRGHLPIVIFNASPSSIVIPPYIRIAQLLLLELKGEAKDYREFEDSKYYGESELSNPKFTDKEIEAILRRAKQ